MKEEQGKMTTSGAIGHVVPVIFSGGSGTRLWPVSRSGRPKQLIALTEEHTMLQATARRTRDSSRFAPPMVVANFAHAGQITQQLDEVGLAPAALILEPVARNTAPAIALAAHEALATDPEAVLLVMPSDHVVADDEAFGAAIDAALPAVAGEAGWRPSALPRPGPRPAMAISSMARRSRRASTASPASSRSRIARPPQAYLDEGGYSWNGGIFLFRADAYLAALERLRRRSRRRPARRWRGRCATGRWSIPIAEAFAASPSEFDRLCGDGEGRAGRGRAGLDGLVRRRQLGRAARHRGQGRRRQCHLRRCRRDRRQGLPDPLGRAAGRRDRGQRSASSPPTTPCW